MKFDYHLLGTILALVSFMWFIIGLCIIVWGNPSGILGIILSFVCLFLAFLCLYKVCHDERY